MSLRATGEGHISLIVFRSGVLNRRNNFLFDPTSDFVETPDLGLDPVYKFSPFRRKLNEMGAANEISPHILDRLPEDFSYSALLEQMRKLREASRCSEARQKRTFEIMCWLADSNYEVSFHADHRIRTNDLSGFEKREQRHRRCRVCPIFR